MPVRPFVLVTTLILCLPIQGGEPGAKPQAPAAAEVRVDGALRAMMHQGVTGRQVELAEILARPHIYGVGALEELSGEITLLNGVAHIAYFENGELKSEVGSQSSKGAALLVSAPVERWQEVELKTATGFAQLDAAIKGLAESTGLDTSQRIPFLIEGVMTDVEWHVIDGDKIPSGPSSHEAHKAAAQTFSAQNVKATLIGFFSASDMGTFTHRGSQTHVHAVVDGHAFAGHVDNLQLPAGTRVRFPATKS